MKHFNAYDGLIHWEDGSKEFVEGGKVDGINTTSSSLTIK